MLGHAIVVPIIAATSITIFAETNILESGLPLVLIHSAEHADLVHESRDVDVVMKQRAQEICARLDKTFSRWTVHTTSADDAREAVESKTYKARVVDVNQPGLVFTAGAFSLVPFTNPPAPIVRLEQGWYAAALITFLGGGITTLMFATGFEGNNDETATVISGVTTLGATVILGVSGLFTRLYRSKCAKPSDEIELTQNVESATPIFAMPVLVSELFCN